MTMTEKIDQVGQVPPLKATIQAGEMTKKMYRRIHERVKAGEPAVWASACNADTTQAILQAMGLVVTYPENYSALLAVKKVAIPYLDICSADGYSSLICGYAQTTLGYGRLVKEQGAIPPNSPLGGMPKPVAMIGATQGCDARFKWLQSQSRYQNVPVFCIDGSSIPADLPFSTTNDMSLKLVKYLTEEWKELVRFLEKNSGKKMNLDRLDEVVNNVLAVRKAWWECYELRKAIPCPMSSKEMWPCITPGWWMADEKESVTFYENLKQELQERISKGIGAIPNEKYRLLWAELPPWHSLNVPTYFEKFGAVCVVESDIYYPQPPPPIPDTCHDPYEKLAWNLYWAWSRLNEKAQKESGSHMVQQYLEWSRDYWCDGAILHFLVSCHPMTFPLAHTREVLLKYAHIPSLVIEGDIIDERMYTEARMKMQAESFAETLESHKKLRQKAGLPVAHPTSI